MSEKLTISTDELAAQLGISRPLAYQLVHREDFPAVRIGRRVIIPKAALAEWLDGQAKGGAAI